VLAAAIRSGMTVRDIAVLELCYAPPYGTSKDPVNAAGYVAGNIIDGTNPVFEYNDIENIDPQKVFLLDVRTKEENERACIPGSHHIPVDDLRERIGELPGDKEIWVYCRAGLRGYVAARILAQHGFNVKNLNGGYRTYQSAVACAHTDYDPFWD
jgi:rhodanese-related sulfurtransferase